MYYSGIKYPDVANGDGCRVTLFVSGCRLACTGCFNPEEQCFTHGKLYSQAVEDDIISKLSNSWISGLSVLGGDPLEPENQPEVLKLVRRAKMECPEKDIWLWTGRVYPNLPKTEHLQDILHHIDVLIDGPFIESQKTNYGEYWYGSSNQRVLRQHNGEWR